MNVFDEADFRSMITYAILNLISKNRYYKLIQVKK